MNKLHKIENLNKIKLTENLDSSIFFKELKTHRLSWFLIELLS